MEPAAATRRLIAPLPNSTPRSRAPPFLPSGRKVIKTSWRGHGSSTRLHCLGRNDAAASPGPPAPAVAEAAPPPPSKEGLVFEVGAAGAWDSLEVGSPVVKRYIGDESERWFLWYHGRGGAGGDCVGLATSANGIHWKREALAVGGSDDWWAFDTGGLRPGEVINMSSAKVSSPGAFYWMYYAGYVADQVPGAIMAADAARRWLPGLAISQDGRHWARIEGEHHTGALMDAGEGGEWDSLSLAAPRVVFHGAGDLRMYYHSFDSQKQEFAVGVARSRDGINWVKLGKVLGGGSAGEFDEGGAMCGHVVQMGREGEGGGGGYLMVYEGVAADGRRSIGVAESPDGLKNWRRRGRGAVLEAAADGGWDDDGVGSPCLVRMDGEEGWRLYYAGVGRGGTSSGIGMAFSDGPDLRSFKRCSGGGSFSLII